MWIARGPVDRVLVFHAGDCMFEAPITLVNEMLLSTVMWLTIS